MDCKYFLEDVNAFAPEDMEKMPTRQLLAEMRRTYTYGDPYVWRDADWNALRTYRAQLKAVLDTREHVPNKHESRGLRKLRKKRGYK